MARKRRSRGIWLPPGGVSPAYYSPAITDNIVLGEVEQTSGVLGFLSSMGHGNASTINISTTIPANYNSVLFGPITIDTDGTLIISDGAAVKIKDIEDC